MDRTEWILCPVCGNKTRNKIKEDTILKNYPLYCPKCKQETLIEVSNLKIPVITEPDALDARADNLVRMKSHRSSALFFYTAQTGQAHRIKKRGSVGSFTMP